MTKCKNTVKCTVKSSTVVHFYSNFNATVLPVAHCKIYRNIANSDKSKCKKKQQHINQTAAERVNASEKRQEWMERRMNMTAGEGGRKRLEWEREREERKRGLF